MTRQLIEIEPNRWRFVDPGAAIAKRSSLAFPSIISDEMPPTEQVDGRFYTSKAKFRAVGRALGLTEVGNEKFKPKTRGSQSQANKSRRIEAWRKAAAQYRQGRRARQDRWD